MKKGDCLFLWPYREQLLVVFDNFEHVLDATRDVVELLTRYSGVLLATNLLVPVPTTGFNTTPASEGALHEIAVQARPRDTVLSVPADCDPAFASLQGVRLDVKLAEAVLRDLIPDASDPDITPAVVMSQTAGFFGVSMDDLCGSSRSRSLVMARQIAMYLCRELTELSLPKIGQQFGGRDHTTVMHAERKIRLLMAERRSIYNQVTELTNRIKQQPR